jgi:hypothetical protein
VEDDFTLTPLTKMEFGSLQQGFALLPKRLCNVKELEINKFYRLTATTIEPVGIRVPRARVSKTGGQHSLSRLSLTSIPLARILPR